MRRGYLFAALILVLIPQSSGAQQVVVPSVVPAGAPYRVSAPVQLPGNDQVVAPPPVTGRPVAQLGGQPAGQPPVAPPVAPPAVPRDPPVLSPLERRLAGAFAQATEAGGQGARTFNENFDGDFGGVFYRRTVVTGYVPVPRVIGVSQRVVGFTPVTMPGTAVTVTTLGTPVSTTTLGTPVLVAPNTGGPPFFLQTNTVTTTQTNTVNTTQTNTVTNQPVIVNDPIVVTDMAAQTRVIRQVLAARYSGILITDNDSPRPQDRVYGGYTFYDNMGGSLSPGFGQVDVQRQLVGFEKTVLNGDGSFGMRLPFVQQYGPPAYGNSQDIGDLTLAFKYAFLNDRATGDLWSAGLLLTTPTGSGTVVLADGTRAPHSTLFQPWTGFVKVLDRFYVQGVTSMIVPTDGRDVTMWNNSVGVGYYVYRSPDRFLTAVVPTGEIHVRTPLNHRNPLGLVYLQDQVNLTGGVHFKFNRATLSAAVCVPVAGPRPWAFEATTFLNISF